MGDGRGGAASLATKSSLRYKGVGSFGEKWRLNGMHKRTIVICVLFAAFAASVAHAAELRVSANQRYLVKDGEPFFYLCDSGWELFMRLDRDEAEAYLKNRAEKGFNVVMATLIGWLPHRDQRNAYGEPPLLDKDPARPNEKYFEHVDYIVEKANAMGIVVAMLPSYSHWMYENVGVGPHPFNATNARSFGEYVGRRYRNHDIIWVLGGDRNPQGYEDILRAMAAGLDEGDGERDFLVTFHGIRIGEPIRPGTVYRKRFGSAHLLGDEAWLDFHGAYSGHQWAYPTYHLIAQDRAMKPTRPVIDLEPCYENHAYLPDGRMYWTSPEAWDGKTRGTAALVREQAYWAVLAGAAGHTYAGDDVWQFHDPARPLGEKDFHANTHWREAMDWPGAVGMGIMRRLFESRPWHTLVPDQSIIVAGQGTGEEHKQAARGAAGAFLFVYLPRGGEVTVAMEKIAGDEVTAYWFDPRSGEATKIGAFGGSGAREFTSPSRGVDHDWVLVLDDAGWEFAVPGRERGGTPNER